MQRTGEQEIGAGSGIGARLLAAVRVSVAALVLLALLFIVANTLGTVDHARTAREVSAVQLIQAYTEGVFWAVLAVGAGVAVYIGTRAFD